MFEVLRPSTEDLQRLIEAASRASVMRPEFLSATDGLLTARVCSGSHANEDWRGGTGLQATVRRFRNWEQFDPGWVRVSNLNARIEVGQIVAVVEVHSIGLWSLNLSQVVEVVRTENRFGFIYRATPHHVEEGEERFVFDVWTRNGSGLVRKRGRLKATRHPCKDRLSGHPGLSAPVCA